MENTQRFVSAISPIMANRDSKDFLNLAFSSFFPEKRKQDAKDMERLQSQLEKMQEMDYNITRSSTGPKLTPVRKKP